MASEALVRGNHPDGRGSTFDRLCHDLITTASAETVAEAAERSDLCDLPQLSTSALAGYRTLTERVLLFLEGHYV